MDEEKSPASSASPIASKELPRAERRKLKKKAKRRQIKVLEKDEYDPDLVSLEDEFRRKQEELERVKVLQIWLANEEEAMRQLQEQKEKEQRLAEEKKIAADRKKAEAEDRKRKREEEKKKQEEEKNRAASLATMSAAELSAIDREYLKTFGTEKDQVHCSFYLKTGSCRYGTACGKGHPRPKVSATLMFKNMFNGMGLSELHQEDAGEDMQHEEKDIYNEFRDFYEDVLPEFEKFGPVMNFKVCRNNTPHLRGNVYVQFRELSDAVKAFTAFNDRFYGGTKLTPEFVPLTKWKAAICGLFERNLCPKGKQCNFLHVFRNPGGRFADADRDFQPLIGSRKRERDDERDYDKDQRHHRSKSHHYRRDRSEDRRRRSDDENEDDRRRERRSDSSSRKYEEKESSRSRRDQSERREKGTIGK